MSVRSFAAEATTDNGFAITGPCLVVAGPTASGKSALAVALAQRLNGEIVNADSMQVYRDLSILTARPSDEEMQTVPHHLYGMLAGDDICTAGLWLSWMHHLLPQIWARRRLPVVVGGTGLYLSALIKGLAPVPDVPEEIRHVVAAAYDDLGAEAFAAHLAVLDPVSATAIPCTNRQRMIRAMEVVRHTGRALSDWQSDPHLGGLRQPPMTVLLEPDRDWLYTRCDRRFIAMLDAGGWDQARQAVTAGLSPEAPVCRALGTRALIAALLGKIEPEAAIATAQRETRNYAKRQMTWFRHQLPADLTIHSPSESPESLELIEKVAKTIAVQVEHEGKALR
ncbi:MAG: tRNA (adenosine(37)-N6)-dimethylallyltransferase MiaA [Rhodospirillaceae bacterium]|nr:tRNA (adenosine(37)-N6)-dimethylallyltransferase MiaA [Rhodospirillaceae bacterium]